MRILYIDVDSLRPDHLGCYGYGRPTSPNIDRVASEGVRFDECYASDMPCMPSRTSLFSGRLGIHTGCVAHTGTRAEPFGEGAARPFRSDWGRTSWMRQLRDAGHRTVTFTGFGERHAAWHWYAGFQEIHDTGRFGHEIAEDVTPGACAWLEAHAGESDWFLHVNLWDVHMPYRIPESVGNRFADDPLPDAWLAQEALDEHRSQPGIRSARDALLLPYAKERPDLNPASLETTADVKLMIDGYDTSIAHADEHVGRILSVLEARGVLDETAVIVSADHGECLGELNAYAGHCFADACTARIPLVVRWPGVTDAVAGGCDGGLRYNIDLATTVSELTGARVPECWDGRSMVRALRGEDDGGRERLVVSQLAQTAQRGVVFRDGGESYLYLRTFRSGFYQMPEEMLFNITRDPRETRDLAPERPDAVRDAAGALREWCESMLRAGAHGDPLEDVLAEPPEVGLDAYVERLRGTGRDDVIARVVSRAGEERAGRAR